MKKTLKIAFVVCIIFAMLSGNIAVIAKSLEENKSAEITAAPQTIGPVQEQSEEAVESPTPAATNETEDEPVEGAENEAEANSQTISESAPAPISEPTPSSTSDLLGSLELKLDLRFPQKKIENRDVMVNLTSKELEITEPIKVSDKDIGKATEKQIYYTFNDLTPGTYEMTITGTGYCSFPETPIEVKANTTTFLNFANGYDASEIDNKGDSEEDSKSTKMGAGLVLLGDVDGKYGITQEDEDVIQKEIESNGNNTKYDLNQDGVVDIVDLSYVAINKGKDIKVAKPRWITNLHYESITSKPLESTTYFEDKNDPTLTNNITEVLQNNDKHVTLQPVGGGDIAPENPVEVEIEIANQQAETEIINIEPSANAENNITDGEFEIEGTNEAGENEKVTCKIINPVKKEEPSPEVAPVNELGVIELGKYAEEPRVISDVPAREAQAKIESDGSITVDFGKKIAVKRVLIKVTGTKGSKLADIAKVEFLNGMSDKIPEPQLGIPELRKKEIDDFVNEESITIRWDNVPNVTGYTVLVRSDLTNTTEEHKVDGHELKLENFGSESIKDQIQNPTTKDFTKYYVSVYSTNGEWKSKPCEEYAVQPKPSGPPQKVTGVTATPGYKLIKVSWNSDRRASDYVVYYRKKDDTQWIQSSPTTDGKEWEVGADGKLTGKQVDTKIGIKETSWTISDLESGTYQVMVTSRNLRGTSPESDTATATTLDVQETKLPKYKQINTSNGKGELTNGIKAAWYQQNGVIRSMKDSPLDFEKGEAIKNPSNNSLISAKGIVDNSYSSYFESTDWDAGGFYDGNDKSLVIEFNEPHKMNYITVAKVQGNDAFDYATLRYRDCDSKSTTYNQQQVRVRASQVALRRDEDNAPYTAIKLAKPITTDRLVIGLADGGRFTVAEMGFYEYDEIEDKINALFADSMHLTLVDDVSTDQAKQAAHAKVNAIEERLNKPDASGETNPESENLKKELKTARDLIDGVALSKVTQINSTMSSWYDAYCADNKKDIEFRGSLNAWQPLGVVGRGGEEITVYVGNPYKTVGESTRLQLVYTQWRAEAGNWTKTVKDLQVGPNTITLPDLISTDREHGGSLYINYTGLKDGEPNRYIDREYAVRVSGGTEIPVLDLSKYEVPDKQNYGGAQRVALTQTERENRIKKYIDELETVVNNIEERHEKECKTYETEYGIQEYGTGDDCLLTATEIVMDDMMYSVSSKQIWDGLTEKGYTTKEQKVKGLEDSLTAMENMMQLFYNQKGLSKEEKATEYAHSFPRSRQNIRCMRMTGSAFMYAGGQHIGIQWNEVKDLSKGVPFNVDAQGKLLDDNGNYFGWGIAHEVGHVINQQAYVHGEVTNNYFSILAQTDNTRNTVRFKYDDVYKKVTSAKTGKAQNVFTQLGLYWQLHLAYDNDGYNYKKYETQKDQLDNLIYARMDTYARDTSKAPKKDIPLTINKGETEDNLMKLACAATQKNVLDFFKAWGMVPSEETVKYAEQYDKETRAIQYVNDEARNYRLEGGSTIDTKTSTVEIQSSITNAENGRIVQKENQPSNEVDISLGINVGANNDANGVLGYEILRTYEEKDPDSEELKVRKVTRPVAFVEANETSYKDIISTINNRVFTYTVVAYDKYLNKIAEKQLEPVKVSHDGTISHEGWEITSNTESSSDVVVNKKNEKDYAVDISDGEKVIQGVNALIKDDNTTTYTGTVKEDKENNPEGYAEITLELPEVKKLVGLRYTADNQIEDDYEIQVSQNGTDWTTVKSRKATVASNIGNFFKTITGQKEAYNGSETLYFTKVDEQGNNEITNYDYDCSYVKFIIHNSQISLKKLDLLGQTGDNVDFEAENAVGINQNEYVYDESQGYKIEPDSIVVRGQYKGNPAYNIVMLWYQPEGSDTWEAVSGNQIIMADDPGKADLGEVVGDQWVYVIDKKLLNDEFKPTDEDNPHYEKIKSGKGKLRAELYRVDNAETLEGERIVSDTLELDIPDNLPTLNLTNDYQK